MSDFTLSDGNEVVFDLSKITIKEYRAFTKGSLLTDEDDAILARCSGLTVDAIQNLSQYEYRLFMGAFFRKATGPIDPNN